MVILGSCSGPHQRTRAELRRRPAPDALHASAREHSGLSAAPEEPLAPPSALACGDDAPRGVRLGATPSRVGVDAWVAALVGDDSLDAARAHGSLENAGSERASGAQLGFPRVAEPWPANSLAMWSAAGCVTCSGAAWMSSITSMGMSSTSLRAAADP